MLSPTHSLSLSLSRTNTLSLIRFQLQLPNQTLSSVTNTFGFMLETLVRINSPITSKFDHAVIVIIVLAPLFELYIFETKQQDSSIFSLEFRLNLVSSRLILVHICTYTPSTKSLFCSSIRTCTVPFSTYVSSQV